jgi:hypothetical protein
MWTADSRPQLNPLARQDPTLLPRLYEAANAQVIIQDGPGAARRVIPQPPRPYPIGLSYRSRVWDLLLLHCPSRGTRTRRETAEPAHHIQGVPAAVAELPPTGGGTMRQLIVPVRP